MQLDHKKISQFQKEILDYYKEFKRELPWRQTKDPYKIMIAEIMLQQTQVDRVITYYHNWLQQWPTVQDLAKAQRTDVLKQWMGLGYNNRAINLQKAAQVIVNEFKGDVIQAVKNFKIIPGIGPYTSCAVQIFSQNANIATVDTNIRRILIHEFELPEKISDKELWTIAEQCVPKGKSRDFHNGLMDYGATFLTSRKTGIKPKTQQSKFQGSDRQIRAKIVRHLLVSEHNTATVKELLSIAGKDCDSDRLETILTKMIKNDLVIEKNKKIVLKG